MRPKPCDCSLFIILMEIPIYLQDLSNNVTKINCPKVIDANDIVKIVANLKSVPDERIKLMYKGSKVQKHQVLELNRGDHFIYLISNPQAGSQKPQEKRVLDNAEEYQVKVNELIALGYGRENVVQAMQQNDNHYYKALIQLVHGKQKKIEEEFSQEVLSIEEQTNILLKEPMIRELAKSISNSSWPETISLIQESNPMLFNLIVSNVDGAMKLFSNSDEGFQRITDQDAKVLIQLREFDASLSDQQLMNLYTENRKDVSSTIREIKKRRQQI